MPFQELSLVKSHANPYTLRYLSKKEMVMTAHMFQRHTASALPPLRSSSPQTDARQTVRHLSSASTASFPRHWSLAQIPILPADATGEAASRLQVTAPGDRYEQEAEHIATQITQRTPLASLSLGPTTSPSLEPLALRRSTQESGQSPSSMPPILEASVQQERGQGQELAPGVRRSMETSFGWSLANVRIHDGTRADRLSRSLGARAFTVGSDIFFRQGVYNPQTRAGRSVLAHELTHVLQQQAIPLPVNQQQQFQAGRRESNQPGERTASPSTLADPVSIHQHTSRPLIQRLIGLEVEVNVPVFAAPKDDTPEALLGALWAGNVPPKTHIQTMSGTTPYRLEADAGGVSGTIDEIYKQWIALISDPKEYFQRTAGFPRRLEYVTDPYSEIHEQFQVQGKERGLDQFYEDVKYLATDIQAALSNTKKGNITSYGQWQAGFPSLQQWTDAFKTIQIGGLEEQEKQTLVSTFFKRINAAITEEVYVQSNIGVLPERIAAFQQLHRENAELRYPLALSHPKFAAKLGALPAVSQCKSILERTAAQQATTLARRYATDVRPLAQAAFEGYMLTLLMSLGGRAIALSEGDQTSVSKNIVNLLPKTPLHQQQQQLPVAIRPAAWFQNQDRRQKDIVTDIRKWFYKTLLAQCKGVAAKAQQDSSLLKRFQTFSLTESGLQQWLEDVLSGKADDFADKHLVPTGSNLPPEDTTRGGRQGAVLEPGGSPTQAIPFETRYPSTRMAVSELETYAKEVVRTLKTAHGDERASVTSGKTSKSDVEEPEKKKLKTMTPD